MHELGSVVTYYGNEKNKSHMLLILNPDIIKDLRSYPLGDYSNEALMALSYKQYGM